MRTHSKAQEEHSPLNILTELAVEGTSSLVEAQRALLDLAQRENEILFHGVKQRLGASSPAVAMTELVQGSLDTLIGMQQELLTNTSKQTLQWLEAEKAGKKDRAAHLVEFAREGVETFTRAQKRFLEMIAKEASKKGNHEHKTEKKAELAELAREAGNAFVEAQKRLLDVLGQQMNVNLDLTTRALDFVKPSRVLPIVNLTGEGVKKFVEEKASAIGSLIHPPKKVAARVKHARARRQPKAATV